MYCTIIPGIAFASIQKEKSHIVKTFWKKHGISIQENKRINLLMINSTNNLKRWLNQNSYFLVPVNYLKKFLFKN
ncbi:hypothetical protein BpHYR1_013291 [Brachionus plicatilis]|uniref:Uncharacterized protein n=1 Tax=Brachionus plicatilis TaxID=10195 RepID=A0A3M7RW17_BRAPC|nr:hypothetical protein BpHYR1_013291 [Brachionus plicatilis]